MTWLGHIWASVVGDAPRPEPHDMDRIREMLDFLKDIDRAGPSAAQQSYHRN